MRPRAEASMARQRVPLHPPGDLRGHLPFFWPLAASMPRCSRPWASGDRRWESGMALGAGGGQVVGLVLRGRDGPDGRGDRLRDRWLPLE